MSRGVCACLSVTTVSCAKMDEPLEMPCRQAVVPRAFPGHHIQQFGRGWTKYITTMWQRQQRDLLQLHTAHGIQNQFIFQLLISKQVASTLTAKGGIAVATCRTTLASAGYSLCIAVAREMSRPRIVISRGGIWTARKSAHLKLRPYGAIQICLLLSLLIFLPQVIQIPGVKN